MTGPTKASTVLLSLPYNSGASLTAKVMASDVQPQRLAPARCGSRQAGELWHAFGVRTQRIGFRNGRGSRVRRHS